MSWMAFVEGFARGTTDIIEKNEAKAEEYADRMREQAERNKGRFAQMQQAVKQNEAFVLRAKALGASDGQISMALDSGPQGLINMVTDLGELKAEMGDYYTPEIAGLRYSVPEDYTSTNIDVASRFFPGGTVGDVQDPTGNFFSRLYGKDAMAQTRADLDRELVEGTGVSIFDMAALNEEQLYQSLNPSVLMSPGNVRFMDEDTTNEAQRNYMNAVNQAVEYATTIYDSEESNINNQYMSAFGTDAEIGGLTKDEALQAAEEKKDATIKNAIRAHLTSQTGIIGYEDAMLLYARDQAGDGINEYHQYAVELLQDPSSTDTSPATSEAEDTFVDPSKRLEYEVEGSGWQTNVFTMDVNIANIPAEYDPVGQRVYYIDEDSGENRSMSVATAQSLARNDGGALTDAKTGQAITAENTLTFEQAIEELDKDMFILSEYLETGLGSGDLDSEYASVENELERLATIRANMLNRGMQTVPTQVEASEDSPQVSQDDRELIANTRKALENPDLSYGELAQIGLVVGARAPFGGSSEENLIEYRENIEAALREMLVPSVSPRPELPTGGFSEEKALEVYGETPRYQRILEAQAQWDAQYSELYNEDGTPKPNHPGYSQ